MFDQIYADFARSKVYNLEPIGIGTPYVESFSGYISRLAIQHSISTGDLMAKIITPMLDKRYLVNQAIKGGEGIYKSSSGLNGIGNLAGNFIVAFEKLTCRKDLSATTLLSWLSVLPSRGLLKKQRAWCSSCYEDDISNQGIPYERLIWSFEMVNICTKHNCYLSFRCPFCNKTNPILTRKSMPGCCFICEKWLGVILNNGAQPIYENHASIDIIEDIVAQNNTYREQKNREHVIGAINYYINECFEGKSSRMAGELNIPLSTIATWLSGGSLPEIKSLIKICGFLRINLSEFLNNKEVNYKSKVIKNPIVRTTDSKERKRHNHQEINDYLNLVITDKLPLSISEIAGKLGCDRKLLSRRYPKECSEIKGIYNKHLKYMKDRRDVEKLREVEEVFYQLIRKNEYPSRRKMEKIIGEGVLQESLLQQKWNSLKEKESIKLG
ncbi:TniQ family protein [Priestia taiwanensis]|uniref:HTH cro/C1-type domain-containing protein n=1 Tax=Priestia taiwanensis TaxID=1347902 RepID=A0A917AVX2_9BACI|nr:TniQ family protein [Priestia taiwanensis]MBM7364460.1 transcriptional regulator with XRE-family HTH domain [Priestia taiwanensis]GGE81314.1 hypothetical protein GCM10007140_33590 [Priestia taiwanensis]